MEGAGPVFTNAATHPNTTMQLDPKDRTLSLARAPFKQLRFAGFKLSLNWVSIVRIPHMWCPSVIWCCCSVLAAFSYFSHHQKLHSSNRRHSFNWMKFLDVKEAKWKTHCSTHLAVQKHHRQSRWRSGVKWRQTVRGDLRHCCGSAQPGCAGEGKSWCQLQERPRRCTPKPPDQTAPAKRKY